MSKKRRNILIVPIFIPNQGCPHICVFCEQEKITAQVKGTLTEAHVTGVLTRAMASEHFETCERREVAFYGGTFTRLPRRYMKTLLRCVAPHIQTGRFQTVRISTRPDALDEDRLDILRTHHVSIVELGAQSMDNRVLDLSKRGHSAEDTIRAVERLKGAGFKVGIQLMPGLPGDSREIFSSTVSRVIRLNPDMVRLYPTVVIEKTELARWYRRGVYRPLSLDAAVTWCQDACERLERKGIPVIRIGLMSSPSLLEEGQILAGPWHTAFGFLVRSRMHHRSIAADLPERRSCTRLRIRAPEPEIPLVRGYRNRGIAWIEESTGASVVGVVADNAVPRGHVKVEEA